MHWFWGPRGRTCECALLSPGRVLGSVPMGAITRAKEESNHVLLLLRLYRLHYSWGRHRQLVQPYPRGVRDGIGDGCQRWDDGNFADAAHAVRMARVGNFDNDGIDHW